MKIAIIDDGIGAFATLNKLKHSIPADYTVVLLEGSFPLGNLNRKQLFVVAEKAFQNALKDGFDAVVFSSIALSMAASKTLAQNSEIPLFGCEAPVLHASTYTASQVLVAGDMFVAQLVRRLPNVIALPLPQFATLAQSGADERDIVRYISENIEKYYGSFDCIALGNSSMNLYRHCFSRVFPNTQIFDSLEGVARKMRKKFKKNNNEDSSVCVVNDKNQDITAKYNFFIEEL